MTDESTVFAKYLEREARKQRIPIMRFLGLIDVNYRTFRKWYLAENSPSITTVAAIRRAITELTEET